MPSCEPERLAVEQAYARVHEALGGTSADLRAAHEDLETRLSALERCKQLGETPQTTAQPERGNLPAVVPTVSVAPRLDDPCAAERVAVAEATQALDRGGGTFRAAANMLEQAQLALEDCERKHREAEAAATHVPAEPAPAPRYVSDQIDASTYGRPATFPELANVRLDRFKSTKGRAAWCRFLLGLDAVPLLAIALIQLTQGFDVLNRATAGTLSQKVYSDYTTAVAGARSWYILILIPAAVIFIAWLHGVTSNVRALGFKPKVGPWASVISWFVPIAQFVLPFRAVKGAYDQLYSELPRRSGLLVAAWWLAFTLPNVYFRLEDGLIGKTPSLATLTMYHWIDIAATLAVAAAAILCILLVGEMETRTNVTAFVVEGELRARRGEHRNPAENLAAFAEAARQDLPRKRGVLRRLRMAVGLPVAIVGVLIILLGGFYTVVFTFSLYGGLWGPLGVLAVLLLPPMWVLAPFVYWVASGQFPGTYFLAWASFWVGISIIGFSAWLGGFADK